MGKKGKSKVSSPNLKTILPYGGLCRALYSSFSSVVARHTKCTRQRYDTIRDVILTCARKPT